MNQKPRGRTSSSEQIIRDIKRKTRKRYSAEEKIRIVLFHTYALWNCRNSTNRGPRYQNEKGVNRSHGLHLVPADTWSTLCPGRTGHFQNAKPG